MSRSTDPDALGPRSLLVMLAVFAGLTGVVVLASTFADAPARPARIEEGGPGIFAPLMAVLLLPGAIPPSWAHELAVFVLLLIQNQLVHELADHEEDRAAGARTTAQLLRGRGTVRAATLVGLVVPPVSLALAPDSGQALLGSAIAAVATGIACAARIDPARARAAHRVTACVGGALLWLFARLVG